MKIEINVELFWSKVDKSESESESESGCWLWKGKLNKRGIGTFQIVIENSKVNKWPHIISWYLSNKEWPNEQLKHTCVNKNCVNPDHLATLVDRCVVNGETIGKRCRVCNQFKPFDDMLKCSDSKDGYSSKCKKCHMDQHWKYKAERPDELFEKNKKYREEHKEEKKEMDRLYRKNNKEYITKQKDIARKEHHDKALSIIIEAKSKPCANCSQVFPHYVMDFHHIDPSTKSFRISAVPGKQMRIDRLIDEVKKNVSFCVLTAIVMRLTQRGQKRENNPAR